LKVHPRGYYAWLSEPQSARAEDDQRLLGLIKHSWLESGGVYGYRKIHDDLREVGGDCGRHRVARLMRLEGLRSQAGIGDALVGMEVSQQSPHPICCSASSMS